MTNVRKIYGGGGLCSSLMCNMHNSLEGRIVAWH